MSVDRRHKNGQWHVVDERGNVYNGDYSYAILAVLMDVRDELQTLNNVFRCHNALAIPDLLRAIKKNTTKKKRKAAKNRLGTDTL